MSVYGKWQTVTIASGDLESSAVDLSRDYDVASIVIPLMDGGELYLKVAERTGSTYYNLGGDSLSFNEMTLFKETPRDEDDESAEDAREDYESFYRADSLKLGGWRFVKICITKPQDSDRSFRIRGMSY